jgi:sugar/nucleoside kinase (ribokinase family)
LRGVLAGWDLETTARFANAVGGLCASGLGTTAGLRDVEGTVAFIQEQDPTFAI